MLYPPSFLSELEEATGELVETFQHPFSVPQGLPHLSGDFCPDSFLSFALGVLRVFMVSCGVRLDEPMRWSRASTWCSGSGPTYLDTAPVHQKHRKWFVHELITRSPDGSYVYYPFPLLRDWCDVVQVRLTTRASVQRQLAMDEEVRFVEQIIAQLEQMTSWMISVLSVLGPA